MLPETINKTGHRHAAKNTSHLAQELLSSAQLTVHEIARRVGYQSEEAFSRAFKRERGQSPGQWRAARATVAPPP